MKKSLLIFLCFMLITGCFGISGFASLNTTFSMLSQSVASGQENVDISPELVYGFSKEVDENSLSSISVNNDKTYIQSSQLDSSGTVLTIALSEELSYYSYYTLDLSNVKDTEGTALGQQITFRTKGCESSEDNVFGIEDSTVADGAASVDVNPSLSFNFNHRITLSGFTPSLNGDTSYIKSYEIQKDDDTVLNITLAKELAGSTHYTLNLTSLKSIYGVSFGKNISFTTADNRILYNIVEDDFDQSSAIDTDKWRKTGKGIGEVISSDGNNFLHLKGTSSGHSQFDNYLKTSANMPGDVVIQFKAMFPKSMTEYSYRPFLHLYSSANNTNLFWIVPNSDKTGFTIKFKDGSEYVAVSEVGIEQWIKITLVLNNDKSTYELYINDIKFERTFTLANPISGSSIDHIRFTAYNGYEIYLDNLKIAQRLALVPNKSGEYECFTDSDGNPITELNSQKTIHKAQFVNNGPADEAMHLFLALYDAETNELLELKQQSFTVKANSHYDITQSFDNLGTNAQNCYIKAIYVNNETDITPYRTAMIPTSALYLATFEE